MIQISIVRLPPDPFLPLHAFRSRHSSISTQSIPSSSGLLWGSNPDLHSQEYDPWVFLHIIDWDVPPHTFLNCPLHMILHRGNVRQYNFSKEAVSGAPVTLYWTALAISKTLWNHRLDKTSLIDMENQGVKYLQFAFVICLHVSK